MADLHFSEHQPTPGEAASVDRVLGVDEAQSSSATARVVRGGLRQRRAARTMLLPALHALQAHAGWISPGGLNHVCRRLQVPPAEAYGVATFYDLFRTTDPGHDQSVTHVCVDPACAIAGSRELLDGMSPSAHAHASPCLGQCERAPALFIQGRNEPDSVPADRAPYTIPQRGSSELRLLRRAGVVDPDSIDSYIEHGGLTAIRTARAMEPIDLIELVERSGLSGRGGAAFPTGAKWRAVRSEIDSGRFGHVVANADESEPGTFKDRVLLEQDPFSLIEAMCVAAHATGARKGWIYVRGEYPLATRRLESAIFQARQHGLFSEGFDIELRRGAGAYICGEETALFNSIEGYRGEPRNKPPYPTTHGLFGEPTAINNPETLVNVLHLLDLGLDAYSAIGTKRSPGTKLFCLSGHVVRPGVYEVPFGTTLGELIELAGGVDGSLGAVLLGGAAGAFVDASRLDLPLTLEHSREQGLSLGSGVVMVFNDQTNMTPLVKRIAEFFRDESCGQCVPCRIGTTRQVEVLDRPVLDESAVHLIDDMATAMADASICGLGHTAAGAVQSALRLGLIESTP